MTVSDILSYARLRAYSNSTQYSDATLLPFLNVRYHQIENALTQLKEDFFYDVFTTNTVAGQNRYVLKTSSATVEGVKKIINTYIKWSADDQFTSKLTIGNTDTDYRGLDEISSEQSKYNGMYLVKGSEIIIYPTPTNSVTGGLSQEVIVNLTDLTTSSIESNIFATSVELHTELRQYHYIMGLGVAADIFGLKGMFNEKSQLDNEYNIAKQIMLDEISDRYSSPIEGQLLNTSFYK